MPRCISAIASRIWKACVTCRSSSTGCPSRVDARDDSDDEHQRGRLAVRPATRRVVTHGDNGRTLIILDFAARELQSITEFRSSRAASAEVAAGAGDAHVHFVEIAAGGAIGPHVAGFGQLFVCLAGEGWVASADDARVPLREGQAAYF